MRSAIIGRVCQQSYLVGENGTVRLKASSFSLQPIFAIRAHPFRAKTEKTLTCVAGGVLSQFALPLAFCLGPAPLWFL